MLSLNLNYKTHNFWGDLETVYSEKKINNISVSDAMKLVKKALNKVCNEPLNYLQVCGDSDNSIDFRGRNYKFFAISQDDVPAGSDVYNVFAIDIQDGTDEFMLSKREITKLIKTMVSNELESEGL